MVRLILVKLSGGWACEVFHLNLVLGVLIFPCCLPRLMSVCVCVCMFVRVCKYRLLFYRTVSMPREFELCGRAANLLQGGYLVSRSDCFISVVCFVVLFACVLRLSRVYFLRCYFVSFVSVAVLSWFAISGRIHYASLKEAL